MAIFNLETRAPYWKDLQFVWFLDTGNVFRRVTRVRLDELRVTSGIGFRYRSPIGPLRVDWGWKVSTRLLETAAASDRTCCTFPSARHSDVAGCAMSRR